VRVSGEDSLNQPNVAQGPALFHQNSSTSMDPLISPNTGANPNSAFSFMRGNINFLKDNAVSGWTHHNLVIQSFYSVYPFE